MTQPAGSPPLTRRQSIGFGIGTIGVAILLQSVTAYFPTFAATVLGLSPAVAGFLLTGSKIYDMGADLAIGAASDRTRSKWGRRRPYLLAGAIVGSAAFALLFFPYPLTGWMLIGLLGLILVLYSTGYSLFNVPYLAMPAEMTEDPHARTKLLSYRTFFIALGQTIAISGAAWIIAEVGGGQNGYMVMGLTLGAVVLVTMMLSFLGTANARQTRPVQGSKVKFLRHATLVVTNQPFMMLIGAKFCVLLAVAVATGAKLLFFLNVVKLGYEAQIYMGLANNLAIALSMPIWVRLSKMMGKKNAYIAASVIYALTLVSWLFMRVGEPMELVVVRGLVGGFATGGILLLGISMLPDAIDFDFKRTGMRREGVFSAVYAVVEKLAFAIGPSLMGFFIAVQGYVPTVQGQLTEQPASAQAALYAGVATIPAVLTMLGIVFMLFYNTRDKAPAAAQAQA